MTVTIKAINNEIYLVNPRLEGGSWKTSKNLLLTNMKEIATWANNTLNEECLFEVE